jgi:hypothetical protein
LVVEEEPIPDLVEVVDLKEFVSPLEAQDAWVEEEMVLPFSAEAVVQHSTMHAIDSVVNHLLLVFLHSEKPAVLDVEAEGVRVVEMEFFEPVLPALGWLVHVLVEVALEERLYVNCCPFLVIWNLQVVVEVELLISAPLFELPSVSPRSKTRQSLCCPLVALQ